MIIISPLPEENKRDAMNLIVESNVGTRNGTLRFFNKSLRQQLLNIYVASEGDSLLGVIGWYTDDGKWAGKSLEKLFPYGDDKYWVSYFAVNSNIRGTGIGSKLMKYLFDELKSKNAKELWTYTLRAKVFYEKLGFTFIKRSKIENKLHYFLKYSF